MVSQRPFVLLSAAMSVDGYIDDASNTRLVLSNEDDMRRVRLMRSDFDAIMVGAETIRRDNPSLAGTGASQPRKVTITTSGQLDVNRRFFEAELPPLVMCPDAVVNRLQQRLGKQAVIEVLDTDAGIAGILAVMCRNGIRRLMVEGGVSIHTQCLQAGAADALRLAVAPYFIGDTAAPRFTGAGAFVHNNRYPMRLQETEQIGDMAVMHYTMDERYG